MKALKIILYTFPAFLLLYSCSGGETQPETTQEKQEQLKEYRDQLSELRLKISALENELKSENQLEDNHSSTIKIAPIRKEPFNHFITVKGIAEAPKNIIMSAEVGGAVNKILVKEGQQVREGELLIQIDDEIISRNIDEIRTNLDLATEIYQRQKNLREKNIGSEVQFLQARNNKLSLERKLESALAQYKKTQIRAPWSGTVDEIFINQGELSSPGIPLIRVIDLSKMKIVAEVSEAYLGKINTGDSVQVSMPGLGIKKKEEISYVGQFVDPGSRSFKIEIAMDNKNGSIKPNVLSNVRFSDYSDEAAILVPSKVVNQSSEGSFVYLANKKENSWIVEKRFVKTGKSFQGKTEILSGLNEGENLITSGFQSVVDKEKVNVK